MAQTAYPLRLIHRYRLRRRDMLSLTDVVARQSPESLRRLPGVPTRRLGVLPHASLLLNRLLRRIQPHAVEFCAYGLREGLLHADLPPEVRAENSLLATCRDIGRQTSRFPGLAPALLRWSTSLADNEAGHEALLRQATCLLSDIAWRAHPDHRADDAFRQVFTHPGLLLEHRDRAFLALAVYHRYTGKELPEMLERVHGLIREEDVQRARILGLALRLGETISGGDPATLDRFSLLRRDEDGRLCLHHAAADRALVGEVVVKRLSGLASAMALGPAIEETHAEGTK
jgi:exopolyphosphatase/guanosine-5'-triphosphate,3'-diphosphate pyrophosphatase